MTLGSKNNGKSKVESEVVEVSNDPLLEAMIEEERVESKDVDLALLLRILAYLKPHSLLAGFCVMMSVVESALMTLPPYIIGLTVDEVTSSSDRKSQFLDERLQTAADGMIRGLGLSTDQTGAVVAFGLLIAAIWILRWSAGIITSYSVQKLGQLVVHDLRLDVFRHICGMDMSFFHRNPLGRLVNRTTFDVRALSELFSEAFSQGVRDFLFVSVLLVVMFSLDTALASVVACTLPLLVGVALSYRYVARPALRTQTAVQSRMNAWMSENISGMRENQLYRTESRRRKEYHRLTDAHQMATHRVIQAWAALRPTLKMISGVAIATILMVGYDRVAAGILTIGLLLTFVQYTMRVWVPIRNLVEKFNVIQTSLTAGERILDILGTPSEMVDTPGHDPSVEVSAGHIRFDDVEFTYPGTSTKVLSGITVDVPAGHTVALVGDTGAGKSTIIHLLSRFYDVDAGAVVVDGRNVRDYSLQNLRRAVALVPQDVVIFADTVRNNITLGAAIEDKKIIDALEAVAATDLVSRFRDGLDHILEESGRTLSAGERQLISFARALILNPPVLVLDEATASIDTGTESRIQRAIERLTKGRTTIVVAHRLSTIRKADQILVLQHGKIVESGRHEELVAFDGVYARLNRAHFEGL